MSGRLRFLRTASGATGAGIVAFVLLVTLFGPYVAPHDPTAAKVNLARAVESLRRRKAAVRAKK